MTERVAIVGAGPAGCALACMLVERGIDCLVFDDDKKPSLLVGESLIPAAMPIIQRLGIEEEISQFSQRKSGAALRQDDVRVDFAFRQNGSKAPAYAYNIPRPKFDSVVRQRAENLGVKFVSQRAQLELGVDYLSSGLLDRAESLLKGLSDSISTQKDISDKACAILVEVYQDMGDWLAAIDFADRLTSKKFSQQGDSWRSLQAYFSTELAQSAYDKKDWSTARRWIRDALRFDKNCIKALVLQAEIETVNENPSCALLAYKYIPGRDARFIPDFLEPFRKCVIELEGNPAYINELREIYKHNPNLFLLAELEKELRRSIGVLSSIELLLKELPRYRKHSGVDQLFEAIVFFQSFEVQGENTTGDVVTARLYAVIDSVLTKDLNYLCERCGYEASDLNWQCPSCKSWGSSSALMLEPAHYK